MHNYPGGDMNTGFLTLVSMQILSRISTGDTFLDMLLCTLMPILMGYLSINAAVVKAKIVAWLWPGPGLERFRRRISYTVPQLIGVVDTENTRTKVLQDAILFYIDSIPKLVSGFPDADLGMVKGQKNENEATRVKSSTNYSYDFDERNENSRADEVQQLKIQAVAPEGVKVQIAPGLFFQKLIIQENSGEEGRDIRKNIVFYLTSPDADGREKINEFCQKAVECYKKSQTSGKDCARYYYTPQLSSKADDAAPQPHMCGNQGVPQGPEYKRYQLSEDKTFTSLFHPEKQQLLQLLDDFIARRGKFAVPGYPQKLGLLLHGPPGTGKTSVIKAMANYTNRNIVSIPLVRVKTNQQLMDLVFDQTYRVQGDDWTYNLPFEKTIFVMEDVDAAANVVHKRDGKEGKDVMLESMSELLDMDIDSKTVGKSAAKKKEKRKKLLELLGDEGLEERMQSSSSDKLNLAGILNVLDGVVDCPGRIVIMTTNHPEKLDPALIRPGRVNKKIYMGALGLEEALQMIQHYLGAVSHQERKDLESAFPAGEISPAALESLCAECKSVGDILGALSCNA